LSARLTPVGHFNGIKTPDDGKKMKEPDSTKTAGHCYCLLLQIYLLLLNKQFMAYKKTEQYEDKITSKLVENYRESLVLLGEDAEREGLLKTPERVAKSMQYLTQGYLMDARAILNSAKFHEDVSEMIIVKDIELYSMCEHHMLPFYGKAHVAYIPNGYITGLSKIARVVDVYARRLQVQERLTHQIMEVIKDTLNPMGVAVVIEASHLCMMMRGVQKQNSVTTTSAFWGEFEKNETRSEFIRLIGSRLH
jgi:GTP cyclohydrolase IA